MKGVFKPVAGSRATAFMPRWRHYLATRIFGTAVASAYLMAAASAALAQTAPAAPQTAATPAPAPPEAEQITVTGIRASLAKSIDLKRNAEAFIDAISAEDIGKFPDQNVAESLAHVPGITISHDFGDGEKVSIEGSDPNKNRTLLNGETVGSVDWYWADVEDPGRAFNFQLLPSEVVGNIEVYKSPEARIDEGSLGGTIIVHTRDPLDLEPITIAVSGDGNYNDRSQDFGEDFSGLVGWRNDDRTLGVLASFVRQDETTRRDGVEMFNYASMDLNQLGSGNPNAPPDNVLVPGGINSTMLIQELIHTGGTFSTEYKPDSHWELTYNLFYDQVSLNNIDQSYYIQPITVWGPGLSIIGTPTIVNGVLVKAQFTAPDPTINTPPASLWPETNPRNLNIANNSVENDAFVRTSAENSYSNDFKLDYRQDDWHASIHGGFTRAWGGTHNEYATNYVGDEAFGYDLTGSVPTVNLQYPATATNKLYYYFGQTDAVVMADQEQYIQGDIEHDLDLGPFTAIMAGVKYTAHKTGVSAWSFDNLNTDPNNPNNPTFYDTGTTSGLVPSNHLSGIGNIGSATFFPMVNTSAQANFLQNGKLLYEAEPQTDFSVTEDNLAGYVESSFAFSDFHGNIGVRAVQTDQNATFNNVAVNSVTPSFDNPTGSVNIVTPVTVSHPYYDIEPSFNIAWDVEKDVVLRFDAAKVLVRDNYSDLAGSVNLNPTNATGSRGNPDLQPTRSKNFDLSAEWYMSKDSLLSGAVFYKDVQSYVNTVTDMEVYSTPGFPVQAYAITHPINGGGGHNEGFEAQFQHDIWGGFGAIANYTYSYAVFTDGGEFPGNSRDAFTMIGYYEDENFSARINYTYRTPWLVMLDQTSPVVVPQYHDSEGELDFTTSYNINKNISIDFDAINLTDNTEEYYDINKTAPVYIYKNGRRFRLGFKAKF